MPASSKALSVVEAVTASFPGKERPTPEQVETVMRPFAPISREVEREIRSLLHQKGGMSLVCKVGAWMEANDVVSGEGREVEARIQFLLMDTCTCVLDHLRAAVAHATKEVDPRVLHLLDHEHLKK